MRTRWIVFNPSLQWIQGDIAGETAAGAAKSVERHLSEPTANAKWEVYEAPADFPGADVAYSGGDATLHGKLRANRMHSIPNGRHEPALAIAC